MADCGESVPATDGGDGGASGAGGRSRVGEEELRRVRASIDAARGHDGRFNVDDVVARLSRDGLRAGADAGPLNLVQINAGIIDMIGKGLIQPSHVLRSDSPSF